MLGNRGTTLYTIPHHDNGDAHGVLWEGQHGHQPTPMRVNCVTIICFCVLCACMIVTIVSIADYHSARCPIRVCFLAHR